MRWIFGLILLITFFSGGIAYADSPSIDDVAIFSGYIEEGDWLIVGVYNISGTNTSTSLCSPYQYQWNIQLINNETSDILTSNLILQCGMKPISIYLNKSYADSLTWGGNYSIKLYALWGTNPNTSLALTNWIGTDLRYLDAWVIYQAGIIGDYYAIDYIENVPIYNEVLNSDGGTIFDIGIPYLSYYRPDIFLVTTEYINIEYEEDAGDSTYADALYDGFNTSVGTELAPILLTVGGYFGVDGRTVALVILILAGLVLACIVEKTLGMMVIIFAVLIGVLHLYVILGFAMLLAIVFTRAFFWSST